MVKWKENISRFILSRFKDDKRTRQGCSLKNAESVGLLYLEKDHNHYRTIKDISKYLQDEMGVRRVSMFSYVDTDIKRIPGWLVKKLDSGYFCKSDLNWFGIPKQEIEAFTEIEFDILFDLELEPNLPLKHVLNRSLAKMKVGPEQEGWEYRDYDVKIGRIEHKPNEDGTPVDLSKVWKEQIERTFKFISEANIQ
tara:strand:+ start:2266 stop:2850 length:585 start_codon:yes stop_codon:yes gene_type:complete